MNGSPQYWFAHIRAIGLLCASLVLSGCATGMVRAGRQPPFNVPSVALPGPSQLVPADRRTFEGMVVHGRGRPVVVNVWASWCPPCRAEAPLLAKASREYSGRILFLGVNSRDRRSDAVKFMKKYGMTFPSVVDVMATIAPSLGVVGLPTTLVYGRDGRLRASIQGGVGEQRLAGQINDALAT